MACDAKRGDRQPPRRGAWALSFVGLLASFAVVAAEEREGAPPVSPPRDVRIAPPEVVDDPPSLVDDEPSRVDDEPPSVVDAGSPDEDAGMAEPPPMVLDGGAPSVRTEDPEDGPTVIDDPATTSPAPARVVDEPEARVVDIESRVVDAPPRKPIVLPPLVPPPPPKVENTLAIGGGFGLLLEPALGLGVLGLGTLEARQPGLGRLSVDARLLATQKLHQDHRVRATIAEPFDLPLFGRATATLFATNALPYCGDDVTYACHSTDAVRALDESGLTGVALRDARAQYHLERVLSAGLALDGGFADRIAFLDVELSLGWTAEGIVDGELGDTDGDRAPDLSPWPRSLRSKETPRGARAFNHGPRARVALRAIDDARFPTRGFALTVIPYASTRALGATYDLIAVAAALEGYVPVFRVTGLVIASRTLLDVGAGDAHPLDRARFHLDDRPLGFGGIDVGRGLRLARHRGLVKIAEQGELRYERVIDSLFDLPVRLGGAAFVDVGYVAPDLAQATLDASRVHFGAGVGARAGLGPVVVRADLAVSPDERFVPLLYLSAGQSF